MRILVYTFKCCKYTLRELKLWLKDKGLARKVN